LARGERAAIDRVSWWFLLNDLFFWSGWFGRQVVHRSGDGPKLPGPFTVLMCAGCEAAAPAPTTVRPTSGSSCQRPTLRSPPGCSRTHDPAEPGCSGASRSEAAAIRWCCPVACGGLTAAEHPGWTATWQAEPLQVLSRQADAWPGLILLESAGDGHRGCCQLEHRHHQPHRHRDARLSPISHPARLFAIEATPQRQEVEARQHAHVHATVAGTPMALQLVLANHCPATASEMWASVLPG
jgi:hypothetical protein